MVGHRLQDSLADVLVAHVGDPGVVGAERGAGDAEPAVGMREGVDDAGTPAHLVAGVVDLVEDHQRAGVLGAGGVQTRFLGDLGVTHDAAVGVGGQPLGVGGVAQVESQCLGGLDPLGAQMVGGTHHDDPVDDVVLPQVGGDRQGEGGLAGAGSGALQPVGGVGGDVPVERLALPGPQPDGHPRTVGREP